MPKLNESTIIRTPRSIESTLLLTLCPARYFRPRQGQGWVHAEGYCWVSPHRCSLNFRTRSCFSFVLTTRRKKSVILGSERGRAWRGRQLWDSFSVVWSETIMKTIIQPFYVWYLQLSHFLNRGLQRRWNSVCPKLKPSAGMISCKYVCRGDSISLHILHSFGVEPRFLLRLSI